MLKVKLSEGNAVSHPTLGTGIVLSADDEFCTIRFASKEAMFRLPDAFEKGFLTSQDAILTEVLDDEEDYEEEYEEAEMIEEEEEAVPQSTKKPKTKVLKPTAGDIILGILVPTVICAPIEILLISSFVDDPTLDFVLIFAGAIVLAHLFLIWLIANIGIFSSKKATSNPGASLSGQHEMSPSTKLIIGLAGAKIIGDQMEKEKQDREKKRYDSLFWAESIRDKNRKDRY